jgi:hypothetical protein
MGLPACGAFVFLILSQKVQERRKRLLTPWRGGAYNPLNNEGGAPLATQKLASRKAPELTRSREPRK